MSRFNYRIAAILGPGVIALENGDPVIKPRNRRAVWHPARAQKEHECAITGQRIPKGSRFWRPATHALYRMDRISDAGMGHLCVTASLAHPGMGRVEKATA